MFSNKKILVMAPHTDDGELGLGGTIAKLLMAGSEVHYAAFSIAENSVPAGLPSDILSKEVIASTQVLGIRRSHVHLFNYPVRHFGSNRQEILDDIIKLRNNISPEVVFIPSSADIHQDHGVIHNEGVRAFKNVTILGYELPWNNLSVHLQCGISLDSDHIELKIKALAQYASQGSRSYFSEDFIRSLSLVRGIQFNTRQAEAFEVIRFCA